MKMSNLQKLLQKFALSADDLNCIRRAGASLEKYLSEILDDYAVWLQNNPEMHDIFKTKQQIEANCVLKRQHWESIWAANINEDYLAFRQRLGGVHAELGIDLNHYFSVLTFFVNKFQALFIAEGMASFELSNAFAKLINLDVSLILDAYSISFEQHLKAQSQAIIASISTPIAQLWEGILLLPLVGVVDSRRAQDIMSSMLQKISTTQSKIFILDISGVPVVDTAVANHFIKMTKASRLMGCKTIISGISPAVAQTIIELGVHIDEISTTNSMQDALKQAFRLVEKNDKSQLVT